MKKIILIRFLGSFIVLIAILMFFSQIYLYYAGETETDLIVSSGPVGITMLYILLIKLPLPIHLASVGIFLQRKFIPISLARFAKFAVIISGLWLGIVFLCKSFIYN